MSMLGKIFVTAAWQVIIVWQGELFPTTHRVTLTSLTSIIGRIGTIIAPLLLDLVRTWEMQQESKINMVKGTIYNRV